jgi:coenzyme F420-0:L-glutamate ligase/coenzyme F420-1:gamma-L-glutamate ligase
MATPQDRAGTETAAVDPPPVRMSVTALGGVGLVRPGDDIAALVIAALEVSGEALADGDIVVLAQKIVSKAEDRYVELDAVSPSPRALELAREVDKDARLVELILSESNGVVRHREGVLVVAHRLGLVLANAGIDSSNVEPGNPGGDGRVLLLPKDPDGSCARLSARLLALTGRTVGVIINDSLGRAWRNGTVGAAIGASGIDALQDLRGRHDLYRRPLNITQVGLADEIAAAASVVMGQADEGRPVVLVRGAPALRAEGTAQELVRPEQQDLFR